MGLHIQGMSVCPCSASKHPPHTEPYQQSYTGSDSQG